MKRRQKVRGGASNVYHCPKCQSVRVRPNGNRALWGSTLAWLCPPRGNDTPFWLAPQQPSASDPAVTHAYRCEDCSHVWVDLEGPEHRLGLLARVLPALLLVVMVGFALWVMLWRHD